MGWWEVSMISDLIGIRFKDGGRDLAGMDCWGLACEVFRRYGVELSDYRIDAHDRAAIFRQYQNVKTNSVEVSGNLPIPCLIFMRFNSARGNHVGVYIGAGKFIHARAKSNSYRVLCPKGGVER
jgi:cell wall-associated NlpC family hydrolase